MNFCDMGAQRVQKVISFPTLLYQLIEKKADRVGMLVTEYMRHLVLLHVQDEIEDIPQVDRDTAKRIIRNWEEMKKGKYIEVDPNDDKALDKALSLK